MEHTVFYITGWAHSPTLHREQVSLSQFLAESDFSYYCFPIICVSIPIPLILIPVPYYKEDQSLLLFLTLQGWECHVVWLWKLCHKFLQWIPSWDCFGSWCLSCLFCLSENFCEVIFNILECPYCTKRHLCHKGKSLPISQRILHEKPAFTEDLGVGLCLWNWLWVVLWKRPAEPIVTGWLQPSGLSAFLMLLIAFVIFLLVIISVDLKCPPV